MSRPHEKLRVFQLADGLVLEIYQRTEHFPEAERYGLQAQLRRAAVSVPSNIVEGSARSSSREFLHFLTLSLGSASEVRYLLGLASRLKLLDPQQIDALESTAGELVRSLRKLISSLRTRAPD